MLVKIGGLASCNHTLVSHSTEGVPERVFGAWFDQKALACAVGTR